MPEPTSLALISMGGMGLAVRWIQRTYRRLKRTFDIVGSFVTLILCAPLMGALALLVKLTSEGPALYAQERVGENGRLFTIYKFRSMTADAEHSTGPVWAKKGDARVTFVGGILRRTHLDELPQLYNVLIGDMSLIGPRPERPFFVEKLKAEIPGYEDRLKVKPGITGLAQVRHKADETLADVRKKIAYDLLYVRRFCLWLDLRIAAQTIPAIFGRRPSSS